MINNILKKTIAVLSVLCLLLGAVPLSVFAAAATDSLVGWDGTVASAFESGSGTEEDPYVIVNGAQLARVGEIDAYRVYFRLDADILLNDTTDWEQWGTADAEGYTIAPANAWTPLPLGSTAVFDGNGHTIYGLYANFPTRNEVGLFGCAYGKILNVTIADSFVCGKSDVGGVAGQCYGTISNCGNHAVITGRSNVGGVVGYARETVTDCFNTGAVVTDNYGGGVVGSGRAVNCRNTGAVRGKNTIGGVVGSGSAENCYNTAAVSGSYDVGGVVGSGSAANSYNTGAVSGNYATGGVVGYVTATVQHCYNIGAITSTDEYGYWVGGVVGDQNYGVVSECYYLDSCVANGNEVGVALSEAQMKQTDSFGGFNFLSVWELGYDTTYPYPTLRAFGSQEYAYVVTRSDPEGVITEAVYKKGETVDLTPPANAEFDFAYWRRPDGTRVYATDTLTAEQDETLTAVWAIRRTSANAWDGSIDTDWQGSGTENDPYLITSAAELAGIAAANRSHYGWDDTTYFKLTTDILLNDGGDRFSEYLVGKHEWTPIGDGYAFCAHFDGDGHTVFGLYIHQPKQETVGLFADADVPVSNLSVVDAFVCGLRNVGGVVGDGDAIACRNSGTVIGEYYVGGVVGAGDATECVNSGTVIGWNDSDDKYVGGVVGYGDAIACQNSGIVRGNNNVGGAVGYGDAIACQNSGMVSGNYNVGGVVGCGDAAQCVNSGTVSGDSRIGGIVGEGTATDSYHSGSANGNRYVGGAVGYGDAIRCYSVGSAGGTRYVGVVSGDGDTTDCYCLDTMAVEDDENVTPLTSEQMQQADSFVGFNFRSVWELGYDESYPYPTLRALGSREYSYVVTLKDGDTVLSETIYPHGATIDLTPPQNAQYNFAYWRRSDGTRVYASDTLTAEQDETLTAVWMVRRSSSSSWDGTVDTSWQGSGTKDDPYLITSAAEFAGIAQENDKHYGWDNEVYFKLTTDIVLNDGGEYFDNLHVGRHEWAPIGEGYAFRANFDGGGHTVSGLYIYLPDEENVGLFGDADGTISDLTIEKSFVQGGENVGSVVGYTYCGVIERCHNHGTVIGDNNVGGVVGYSYYYIVTSCSNTGDVSGRDCVGGIAGTTYFENVVDSHNSGTVRGEYDVGGVVGNGHALSSSNSGAVLGSHSAVGGVVGRGSAHDCRNSGTVIGGYYVGDTTASHNSGTVNGNYYVGGVVGYGSAENSDNSGEVNGETYVGGVVGHGDVTASRNSGTVHGTYYIGGILGEGDAVNSHNAGAIGGTDFVGGVVGYGDAQNSYNLGTVQGESYIGGVVGNGTVTDGYNVGDVQGNMYVGGVVGHAYDTLSDCYNRGTVNGNDYVGGVVGYTSYNVENGYYLDTSVQGDSEYGIPLSEEQMKTAESYVGFDFETYWTFDSEASYPYPTLTGNEHVDYVTVTFLGKDGAVLSSETLVKGTPISYPNTAELFYADADHVYRFLRWDKTPYSADEDYTISAQYEKVEKLTIAPTALSMTVDYGYSLDNLRVDTESLYRRLVLSTTTDYRVMSEMTWDLEAYDPTVAGDYVLVGTAALLASPYYKAGGDITLTVTVADAGDQTHIFKENDLVYEVNGASAAVVGYNGSAQHVILPSTLGGKTVTKIGDGAFKNNTAVLSVRLPSTVQSIGAEAFMGCTDLREIALPDGVQTIGERAFYDTSLPSVTCGAAIQSIGACAFGFYGETPTKTDGFLVCGYADTAAEVYATDNGFGYVTTVLSVDAETGVSAVIDERVTLAVVPVTEGTHFETATQILENTDGVTMFDITVHNTDSEAVQPDNMITVSIPLPERYRSSECRIYRINDDGSFKDMKATVVGDNVMFQTSHLSYYAVISIAGEVTVGDITGDGVINTMDALRLFAAMSGATTLNEAALAASDITGDGVINMMDALALYGRVSGS